MQEVCNRLKLGRKGRKSNLDTVCELDHYQLHKLSEVKVNRSLQELLTLIHFTFKL